jgi:hypothetical protein
MVALDKLGQLYPATFRVLLLAAREALRLMDTETRLNGHAPDPIAVQWRSDGDGDLPSCLSGFEVSHGLGYLVQWVGRADARG